MAPGDLGLVVGLVAGAGLGLGAALWFGITLGLGTAVGIAVGLGVAIGLGVASGSAADAMGRRRLAQVRVVRASKRRGARR